MIKIIRKLFLLLFSTKSLCEEITERPHINTPVKLGRIEFNKITKDIYIRKWN